MNTSAIKSEESWIVFGNRYNENNLYLNDISNNRIEFKVEDNTHSIKFIDPIETKIWKFNFTKFLTVNAN